MLSLKRSRYRTSVALIASGLLLATQPAAICTIVCLTRMEVAAMQGGHGDHMGMAPCHTEYGVTTAHPHPVLGFVAHPSSGHLVLTGDARPALVLEPALAPPVVVPEIRTPPPRLG